MCFRLVQILNVNAFQAVLMSSTPYLELSLLSSLASNAGSATESCCHVHPSVTLGNRFYKTLTS